ncbi:MAG: TldD/PmbA family protein [Theionarchaea archaeon]|nr:TldD/PmbA family protein [Theionarchaea archaeon]
MLRECCEKAVNEALKLGSDQAEAFAQKKHVFVAQFSADTLVQNVERESCGIGVRVNQKKATGFAYSTQLKDIEVPAKDAVTAARLVAPDPFFGSLPEPQPFPQLPDIYDSQFDALQTRDVQDTFLRTIENIEKGTGTFQITLRECSIVSSNGISVAYKKSDYSCRFSVVRNVAASYCNFSKMDIQAIPVFLQRILERKPFPQHRVNWDGKGQVILEPNAVTDLIRPLIAAMNGMNVVEKRSHLLGKEDERIVSEEISLHDDGCYPNGLFTQPVDGEGIPSQRTPLIEKGILKNFIYDSYYAHRSGKRSTGNALREGFRTLPACLFTNLVFKKGNASRDELITDTQHGILVNSLGTTTVNPQTSRIAVPISKGFLIKKGEITAALHPAILSGDILTFLDDVIISREQEQIFRFFNPWIKVKYQK